MIIYLLKSGANSSIYTKLMYAYSFNSLSLNFVDKDLKKSYLLVKKTICLTMPMNFCE